MNRPVAIALILVAIMSQGNTRAQTDINPLEDSVWDESGYPHVTGPDRFEEWRPESFWRLFYKGELGSGYEATGVEDFEHYERARRAQQAQPTTKTPAVPAAIASEPPNPVNAPIKHAYYTEDGSLLVTISERTLTMTETEIPHRSRSIALPPPPASGPKPPAITRFAEHRYAISIAPFVLKTVHFDEITDGSVRHEIPNSFDPVTAQPRHGVLRLDDNRVFAWAARSRPIPHAEGRIHDLSTGKTSPAIVLNITGSSWPRLVSIRRLSNSQSTLLLRFDGVDHNGLGRGSGIYALEPESVESRLIATIPTTRQQAELKRIVMTRDQQLIPVYANQSGEMVLERTTPHALQRSQVPLILRGNAPFRLSFAPDGQTALVWNRLGQLWWINLQGTPAVIAGFELPSAVGARAWDIRLMPDGRFELVNDNGRHHFTPFPPKAQQRLQPFLDAHDLFERGLSAEARELLERAVLGDPGFAARGNDTPALFWVDLIDLILSSDWRDNYTETGLALVRIIKDAPDKLRDQALTLYALLAQTGGHRVLARRAIDAISTSDQADTLHWALVDQAKTAPRTPLANDDITVLMHWLHHVPEAFNDALTTNRNRLAFILKSKHLPDGHQTLISGGTRFPDLKGRLIRGHRADKNDNAPIRFLPAR